ncbi:MAG: WG repeat-containing protein [Lachnospiraceae bacterium]|nr:WG repeat-containing protein [Lachnospiraceae bacterium]
MKRKVLCFILVLVMSMGISITAFAETSVNVNGKQVNAPAGCEVVTDGVTAIEDMIVVRNITDAYGNNSKYGVMNINGSMVVPLIYDNINLFSEGLAAVCVSQPYQYELYPGVMVTASNDKIGFIDKTGNVVIPMIYDSISSSTVSWGDGSTGTGSRKSPGFSEGLVSVQKDGKWGVIDRLGNTIIPFKYDLPVGSFHNGLASYSSGTKSGFVNSSGKVVVPAKYDYVADFSEGYAIVAKNNPASQYGDMLYGAVDMQGNLCVPMQFGYMQNFKEGMACVSDQPYGKGYYGFVNTAGALAVPIQYTKAYSFSNGLAVVAVRDERFAEPVIQNRYGYINTQGNVVVPLEYSNAYTFENGIGKASLNEADHLGNGTSAQFSGNAQYVYFDVNGNKVNR